MDLLNYVMDNALILVPVLYIIGAFLKAIPKIPDWIIPWTLLLLGMFGGLALVGLNVDGIIQGILVAGVTVFTNQLIKQTGAKE